MRLHSSTENQPFATLWGGWLRLGVHILGEKALWAALGLGLVLLIAAYQSPRSLYVDIGGPFDTPHTPGFYQPEQSGQATFRWSAAHSSLYFPGVGRPIAPLSVLAQLSSGRAAGTAPIEVGVSVNGHQSPPLMLSAKSESYSIAVDPSWINPFDGNLTVDFASPTFKSGADKRDLGFTADFTRLASGSLVVPPVVQLVLLLVSALMLYWLARACWLRPNPAALLAGLFVAGCAGVIAVQKLMLTVFTARLALTLLLAIILAMLAEPLARWLVRAAGRDASQRLPEWSWAGLRALILLSAMLKVGGLLYPHTNIVDAYFHLKEITYMAEGRPWEQFFGKNLSLSVMPKEEWGEARAFIPYSPFFYVVAAPLARLPWPIANTVPVVAALLEALKVPFVFLLGLSLGRRGHATRTALASASFYTFFPATFLLQQWGNWPTQLSLWLATLWAAIACLFWNRLRPAIWVATTLILSLTLLSYTVTAVYMGIFISLLSIGGWIFAPAERRTWAGLLLSLVVASLVSLLVFYGQYIPVILNETLPTFGNAVNDQGKLTTLRPTLGAFITGTVGQAMQSYSLAIPYAIGLAGGLLVFFGSRVAARPVQVHSRRSFGAIFPGPQAAIARAHWKHVWLAAWLLCFPIITVADFYIDQALKEFWFAIPAIAVVAGTWLLTMQKKGATSRVFLLFMGLLWGTLAWQSLSLWIFRLLFHNR